MPKRLIISLRSMTPQLYWALDRIDADASRNCAFRVRLPRTKLRNDEHPPGRACG